MEGNDAPTQPKKLKPGDRVIYKGINPETKKFEKRHGSVVKEFHDSGVITYSVNWDQPNKKRDHHSYHASLLELEGSEESNSPWRAEWYRRNVGDMSLQTKERNYHDLQQILKSTPDIPENLQDLQDLQAAIQILRENGIAQEEYAKAENKEDE